MPIKAITAMKMAWGMVIIAGISHLQIKNPKTAILAAMAKNSSGTNAHNGESLLSVSLRIRTLCFKRSIWLSKLITVTNFFYYFLFLILWAWVILIPQ